MATPQDCSINVATESTYGTYVAGTRAFEFDDESFTFEPSRAEGEGLKVSARTKLAYRSVDTVKAGSGSLTIPAMTKGMGILLSAACGTNSVTLVSGSTYQHNFTLGDTPASLSIQKSIPRTTSGTVDPYSFLGCMVSSWSFDGANSEIPSFSFDFDVRNLDTAQAFASLTYPSLGVGSIYSFKDSAALYGGTLTVPTTTALGTGATAVTDVRDFKLEVNNNLTDDRFNIGGAGLKSKPTVGMREISGSFTAEYEATTYRDDFLANTSRPLVVTYTSAESLSTGTSTLQFVLPDVKLRSAIPVANKGDLVTVEHNFTAYQTTTSAQAIYVVLRTADTAI